MRKDLEENMRKKSSNNNLFAIQDSAFKPMSVKRGMGLIELDDTAYVKPSRMT